MLPLGDHSIVQSLILLVEGFIDGSDIIIGFRMFLKISESVSCLGLDVLLSVLSSDLVSELVREALVSACEAEDSQYHRSYDAVLERSNCAEDEHESQHEGKKREKCRKGRILIGPVDYRYH